MAQQSHLPAVLTVADIATYLRVSETTVWRWCASGKLPAFRIGRSWRVRGEDFEAMIADHVHPHEQPPSEENTHKHDEC